MPCSCAVSGLHRCRSVWHTLCLLLPVTTLYCLPVYCLSMYCLHVQPPSIRPQVMANYKTWVDRQAADQAAAAAAAAAAATAEGDAAEESNQADE